MSRPIALIKLTSHCTNMETATDVRYDSEISKSCAPAFIESVAADINALIGKPAQVSYRNLLGHLARVEPESLMKRDANGELKLIHTGIISPAYAAELVDRLNRGDRLFVRRFQPKPTLQSNTGFVMRRSRGEVFPLTYFAKLECTKAGWKDGGTIGDNMQVCATALRSFLKKINPVKHRIKRGIGSDRVVASVLAHNLVLAPHPSILDRIRNEGLPVDEVLELAARRAIETLERKKEAKIFAVAGVHLEGTSGVRPHLHVRMAAYDSNGNYVALFDRNNGSRAGNRVILQTEIEQQILRQIERRERRER